MPQDIPLEASELLPFTPASLKNIENAPSFTLRATTPRDRRFHQRRFVEEGVSRHDGAAIRAEILVAIKHLSGDDGYAKIAPALKDVWEARDQFELQRADEPDLVFEYDQEILDGADLAVNKVMKQWPPLRMMVADNIDFNDMVPLVVASVVVNSWTGLKVPREIDRGYLTTECITAVKDALDKFEADNQELYDLEPGTAWAELFGACAMRMALDKEEAGNSASLSPSGTSPEPSTATTTSAKAGKSRKSASSSTKTPATA